MKLQDSVTFGDDDGLETDHQNMKRINDINDPG